MATSPSGARHGQVAPAAGELRIRLVRQQERQSDVRARLAAARETFRPPAPRTGEDSA